MYFRWHDLKSFILSDFQRDHSFSDKDEGDVYAPMDIVVSGNLVQVWIDLPGVQESDLRIYRYNDYLAIEGVKQSHYPRNENKVFLRMERQSAHFRKLLQIPESENIDSLQFNLNDGVLHIVWQR